MKKVLLILNPVAGKLKARSALFDIVNTFCKASWRVTIQTTQSRGHAVELARNAAAEGFDLVVCCGGDGTLNETLSGLVMSGADIPFGYIPAGSTNDFADTLGLSPIPADAAAAITNETPFPVDMGRFGEDRLFSYIASFGAFTSASYSAPQNMKNKIGHLAYVLQGIKDVGDIKPIKVSYSANGQEYSGDYIFGSVSNTTSVAGIVKLKPSIVDLQDGLFEVMMVHSPKNIGELGEILACVTSSKFDSRMFEFFKTDKIEFNMEDPVNWTLDGEVAEAQSPISIRIMPKALTLYK